jgi:Ca2+-binding EF-hand superfamily protein
VKRKKSKEERKRDREITELYHKKLTEDELQPLYERFTEWHTGNLPYFELTEHIHQFHKKNQEIWKLFNYNGWDDEFLLHLAKKELDMLTDDEKQNYEGLFDK